MLLNSNSISELMDQQESIEEFEIVEGGYKGASESPKETPKAKLKAKLKAALKAMLRAMLEAMPTAMLKAIGNLGEARGTWEHAALQLPMLRKSRSPKSAPNWGNICGHADSLSILKIRDN